MSDWSNAVITNLGKNALASLAAGMAEVDIKSIAIGSGTYDDSEKETLALAQSIALKSQKASNDISFKDVSDEDTLEVKAYVSNDGITVGFSVTEVGVFADVTKGGVTRTILFAIAVAGNNPDYMTAYDEYPQVIIEDFYLKNSNIANVTVELSSAAYALAEDIEPLYSGYSYNIITVGGAKINTADGHEIAAADHLIKASELRLEIQSLKAEIKALRSYVNTRFERR
jgi:hypothetical protein